MPIALEIRKTRAKPTDIVLIPRCNAGNIGARELRAAVRRTLSPRHVAAGRRRDGSKSEGFSQAVHFGDWIQFN